MGPVSSSVAIGYRGASPRFREGGTVILLSVMAVQMLSGKCSGIVVCSVDDEIHWSASLGSFVNILMD